MTERRRARISMDPTGSVWWRGQQERCGVLCRAEDRQSQSHDEPMVPWLMRHMAGLGGCPGDGVGSMWESGTIVWPKEKLSGPPSMTMWQVSLKVVLNLNWKSLERLHFLFHVLRVLRTLMGEILHF